MDEQNQAINPTMRPRRTHSAKPPIKRDSGEEQPATTKKHEAYVAKRRTTYFVNKKFLGSFVSTSKYVAFHISIAKNLMEIKSRKASIKF